MRSRIIRSLMMVGLASTMIAGCATVQSRTLAEEPTVVKNTKNIASAEVKRDDSAFYKGKSSSTVSLEPTAQTSNPNQTKPSPTVVETGNNARIVPPKRVSGAKANHSKSDAEINGWTIDYFDGFDIPIEQTKWVRYGWGEPPVGHGCMGVMSQRNSFTRDGKLVIRTQYENGQWSTGGAGSGDIFTASRGRWEVRAKFPKAKGVGYVFLLWPKDEGWPPEIDFAEGRVNGPSVMGVYHWDPDNKQAHRFFDNRDMSGWHTYGVIVEKDHIIFTFDGEPWGRIEHPNVTDKQMFLGLQAGAMDPNGWQRNTETVDNGVPGPLTPAVADIEVDYVAHYTKK